MHEVKDRHRDKAGLHNCSRSWGIDANLVEAMCGSETHLHCGIVSCCLLTTEGPCNKWWAWWMHGAKLILVL